MAEQKYLDEGNATGCTPLPDEPPEKPKPPEMVALVAPERKRTYVYPDGFRLTYENVTHVCVRSSGTHRLNLKDGTKVIVNPGWVAVELDMDEWTF